MSLEGHGVHKVEQTMKHFVVMMAMCLMGFWVGASIGGAAMRLTSMLYGFVGASMIGLVAWLYLEIGQHNIQEAMQNSRTVHQVVEMLHSDWARAMLLLCFN